MAYTPEVTTLLSQVTLLSQRLTQLSNSVVMKTGSTMTGALYLPGTGNTQAATQQFVLNSIPKTGVGPIGPMGPAGPAGPRGLQGLSGGSAGSGSSVSVGLSMPAVFSVSGSPVTSTGTLTVAWETQTSGTTLIANGAGVPTFRLLASSDIPTLDASKITTGVFSATQIPSLDASKITTGVFNASRIPEASGSSLGGVMLAGDWGGTAIDPVNVGIQGQPWSTTAPTNGQVPTWNTSENQWVPGTPSGGSSPYTPPILTNFTAANTPVGATSYQNSLGLLGVTLNCPEDGLDLFALLSKTSPGATFTIISGYSSVLLSAGNNCGAGVFAVDASGKVVTCGTDYDGACIANANYWSNYTTWSSNPLSTGTGPIVTNWVKLVYDGTNFNLYVGTDLNAMVLAWTASATAFLSGAPVGVGFYLFGYSTPIAANFFYWYQGA